MSIPYIASADAGGGGGAGGSIILDVRAFGPSTLTLEANGGNGANHNWGGGANNCKGTGGGGGGGVVWLQEASIPVNLAISVAGGAAGVQGGGSCSGLGNNGSTNGANGSSMISLARPFGAVFYPPCQGPLGISAFTAQASIGSRSVDLAWSMATTGNTAGYFEILRSADGQNFDAIGMQQEANALSNYQFSDAQPLDGANWYQVKRIDLNGVETKSEVKMVMFNSKAITIESLYPNPLSQSQQLKLVLNSPVNMNADLAVFDLAGKSIVNTKLNLKQGGNVFTVPTEMLSSGIYFLRINAGSFGGVIRKLKVN